MTARSDRLRETILHDLLLIDPSSGDVAIRLKSGGGYRLAWSGGTRLANEIADAIVAAVVAVLDEDERDEWRVCIRKPSHSDYPTVYGTAWDRAEAEDDLDACRKLYVDDEPWMESRRVRKTDWERVPDAS